MPKNVYLFISPHLDDVVLSCGGYISRLAAAGENVIIGTVATADVPEGTLLSRQMQWRHIIWGQGKTPFVARRREDAAAATILGVRYLHLDFLDAIYRCDANNQPLYPINNAHVPIHLYDLKNYEPDLCQKFQQILRARDGCQVRVFCPLAIGAHVDHIIVRTAVEEVCEPQNIIYYEDFPYVAKTDSIPSSLNLSIKNENWLSKTVELAPNEIEARITAAACHLSQMRILFPSKLQHLQNRISFHLPIIGRYLYWPTSSKASRRRVSLSLRSYISRVGGERYWFRSAEQIPDMFFISRDGKDMPKR